ncbi:MAG: hypothetical protein LUD25_02975 [Coriobacteriaceae bacterium]|nr:hypothetical protein [Coriobacteriaceae bacterium]
MYVRVMSKVFLVVFLVVMGATLGTKCLDGLGVEFPDWLSIGNEKSYLEGRDYETLPEPTLEAVQSQEFQDNFEQFMADATPMKDSALLANAQVQRSSITLSAAVFGYTTYPTFFESEYVYDAAHDAVMPTLTSADEEKAAQYETAAEAYQAFAKRHTDIGMAIYENDRLGMSTNNPTDMLVSDPVDTSFVEEHFYDGLGEGIAVIDGTYDDLEDALENYFKTDHHWRISGAYAAYVSILSELEPDAVPITDYETVDFSADPFYGSSARAGLYLTADPDHIEDYWIDLSGIEVSMDGEERPTSSLDHRTEYERGEENQELFTNHYAGYFHTDYGLIKLHNPKATSDKSLLIVSDSYSNNMERFFTSEYEYVYVIDPRYHSRTLDEFLEKHEVDDIAFINSSLNIASEETVAVLSEWTVDGQS